MDSTLQLHPNPTGWLLKSELAPHVDAFTHYLTERRYKRYTVLRYLGCVAHFARWTTRCHLEIQRIDEESVQRFLDDHLPRCNCPEPVCRCHHELRAACKHLLLVLRTNAVITERPLGISPVDEELRHFDEHMSQVRGLAPKTRGMRLHTMRRFLIEQFADQPVVMSAIKPEAVRKFVAGQIELYKSPAGAGTLAAALRGHFRFRTSCGDQVHGLAGVVSSPANWQLASLPQALSAPEVARLLDSFSLDGPSARRANAMVRCALDLGLRTREVAKLGLDDIDWRAGTVMLRRTKSRREDILPLPAAAGRAIADYLQFERPQTSNRAVFVRHVAPRDEPISPDVVRRGLYGKPIAALACRTPGRTFCATPWPVAFWRGAVRSRRLPMSCGTAR